VPHRVARRWTRSRSVLVGLLILGLLMAGVMVALRLHKHGPL
jgi:hypothetical protein